MFLEGISRCSGAARHNVQSGNKDAAYERPKHPSDSVKIPKKRQSSHIAALANNDAIDYNEWLEIFSLETPAGQDLTKADTIKVGDANVVEASRHSCVTDWLKKCAHNMDNASSPLTSVEDGDHSGDIVVQQPRKRRRTLRATSQSSTPSPTLPATLLDGLQKGEPQQLAAFIALSKVIDGIARQGGSIIS